MTFQLDHTDPAPAPVARNSSRVPEFVRPDPVGSGAQAPDSAASVDEVPASRTAPAVQPPTWSGKKTAVAAALAIGFASVGAVAAAAAVPTQSAETGQLPDVLGGFGQLGQGGMTGPGGRAPATPGRQSDGTARTS